MPRYSRSLVRAAAEELKLSPRQVYTLIKRCRSGEMASLVSGRRFETAIGQHRPPPHQEREAKAYDEPGY